MVADPLKPILRAPSEYRVLSVHSRSQASRLYQYLVSVELSRLLSRAKMDVGTFSSSRLEANVVDRSHGSVLIDEILSISMDQICRQLSS